MNTCRTRKQAVRDTRPSIRSDGRSLLLLDLENLLGYDPDLAPDDAWSIAASEVLEAADAADDDLVIVAVSPRRAFHARDAVPGALLRCRRGVDGADLALINELIDEHHLVGRFDRIVITSGDGIFTEHVTRLVTVGLRVDHVAQRGSCSPALRLAVHHTTWLPNHHWDTGSDAA